MPRKLLLDCGDGRTILEYVYHKVSQVDWADVYIAAADDPVYFEAIKFAPDKNVIPVFNTKNGTDSCYQAYKNAGLNHNIIINCQTDNVGITVKTLTKLYNYFCDNHPNGILSGCYEISKEEAQDPNRVKLIRTFGYEQVGGRALYFSRLPIPYGAKKYICHFGCYFFWKDYLEDIGEHTFSQHSNLESEKLEQLYWLEQGYKIYTEWVEPSFAIDSAEDYEQFRNSRKIQTSN